MDAEIIVLFLRIIVPLIIFRWNFWGGVICLLLDANDAVLIRLLGGTLWTNYHLIDKVLDMHYLIIEFIVLFKWKDIVKNFGIATFTMRAIGFVLFEFTGIRQILFLFPNVFEYWYLFWNFVKDFKIRYTPSTTQLFLIIIVITVIKLSQEFILHMINNCDKYVYCGVELLF